MGKAWESWDSSCPASSESRLRTLLGWTFVSSFHLYSESLELGCSGLHLSRVTCQVVHLHHLRVADLWISLTAERRYF